MKIMLLLSDLMIPLVLIAIIGYSLLKKAPVFHLFIKGARDGFKIVWDILPTLIGLMVAVSVLRESGFLSFITGLITPLAKRIAFPPAVIPIILMRMVSASAATGMVIDVFKTYGPDSFVGRLTSIMMGCTETILYTLSIYFLSVNIKKTKYTLAGALIATFAGIFASVIIAYYLYG